MFHQIERRLEVFSVAVWVEVLYNEMNEPGNVVVVVSCGVLLSTIRGASPIADEILETLRSIAA